MCVSKNLVYVCTLYNYLYIFNSKYTLKSNTVYIRDFKTNLLRFFYKESLFLLLMNHVRLKSLIYIIGYLRLKCTK